MNPNRQLLVLVFVGTHFPVPVVGAVAAVIRRRRPGIILVPSLVESQRLATVTRSFSNPNMAGHTARCGCPARIKTRVCYERADVRRPADLGLRCDRPAMTVYSPTGTNTGVAMVVFPGGGHKALAMDLEGAEILAWL